MNFLEYSHNFVFFSAKEFLPKKAKEDPFKVNTFSATSNQKDKTVLLF